MAASKFEFTFRDLFDLTEIQKLQDEFALAFGVASIVTDVNGNPITTPSNFSSLCSNIIRKTDIGLKNCAKSDIVISNNSPDHPIIQQCLTSGLWDASAKIVIEGQHVANWRIGQVRDESQTKDQVIKCAQEIGADEDIFYKEFIKATPMSRERFEIIANMLFTLANQLSKQAYQVLEHKKALNHLKQVQGEHSRLAMVASKTHSAVIITDNNGLIEWINDAFTRITKYEFNEVVGKTPASILNGKNTSQTTVEYMRNRLTKGLGVSVELINYTKDDDEIYLDIEIRPIRDESGNIINYIAIEQDITHKKQIEKEKEEMQQQFLMTSKLASIGELAAGIAHEINNPLAIIKGYQEILEAKLKKNKRIYTNTKKGLKAQETALTRISTIVDGLRVYSRMNVVERENVEINEIINSSIELIGNVFEKQNNIKIKTLLYPGILNIQASSGKLQQVIMNLLSNSKDALKINGGGQITIETKKNDQQIIIELSDNGPGIPQEEHHKIFDTFYTTKEVGEGAGLGLSIANSIIHEFKGTIKLKSKEGHGATFIITLPEALCDELEETNKSEDKIKLKGKAIVIDDEEDIRFILTDTLQSLGFDVREAPNGKEALKVIKKEHFDLIVTDLKMPTMGGEELIKKVFQLKETKDSNILIITGDIEENPFADDNIPTNNRKIYSITKPFSRDTIYQNLLKVFKKAS